MKAILITFSLFIALCSTAFAAEETGAYASPKCDAAKIKEIAGDGVVKVEKGAWEGGHNVTIDNSKTNSGELIGKMVAAGCM